MINKLIDIIGREAAVFESFLSLLEKQQRMLVENNVDGLNEVTDLQRELMVKSQILNNQRLDVISQIKETQNIDGDLTVSRLIKLVEETQANRLSELRDSILNLNEKINKTRNSNAILLNRSREFINHTMEMLSKISAPQAGYNSSGSSNSNNSNVMVDRRA